MQVSSLLPAALPSLFLKSLASGGPASALAISVLPGLGPGWIVRAHLNALFHLVLSPPSRGPGEGPAASASLVKTPDLALACVWLLSSVHPHASVLTVRGWSRD